MIDERLGLKDRLSNAWQAADIDGPMPRLVVAEGVAVARDARVREAMVERLSTLAAEDFAPGEWSGAELSAAGDLIAKYGGDEWTRRT